MTRFAKLFEIDGHQVLAHVIVDDERDNALSLAFAMWCEAGRMQWTLQGELGSDPTKVIDLATDANARAAFEKMMPFVEALT